jgi:cytochrome c-type biogenesis protein CcmH/NrfF
MSLERDQLVAGRHRALPPARLSPRARLALWALRVFVLVLGAMVIYTFVAQL